MSSSQTALSTTGVLNTNTSFVTFSFSETNCIKYSTSSCKSFNKSSVQCFGSSLPYDSTSLELVSDATTFEEAKEKLLLWSGV